MIPIREYWPDFLSEFKEFQEISNTDNIEISLIRQAVADLLNVQFIQTATENGIARREKMLTITPFANDDLESRRFRVQAKWNDKLPYTYRELVDKMNNLCGENGYVMVLNSNLYTLNIKLELINRRMFNEIEKITRKMVPANIIITVELRYNQHLKLANFTHGQLAAYSYYQLKSEVIS
ncbi:Uncharacterized protein conserved in bacteria (DUF2313) [Desulfosporosinus orientis DSM 765]|uniref:Uncharacterized protein conserved in bacteria (DUF2313) n=1 Tax=Desulfosporosinus orientis (strain ATCC 19365 / DSM 765 / NCIMB 8382 / VKM B-1628 / Singapore I) TaxID=768706 RepID=G7WEE4_DESOD|nr:putative phage tail protein [Desulfosporosinus orientis]AET70757.1 Uncharacterized protein conserved in bacteria (DUF2313) [Desulfosporosinus orientis DSM 765]